MDKDQIKVLFIQQLEKTPIIQVCCEKLNVSRASFYRMKSEDKKFNKEAEEALAEGRRLVNDIAESRLLTAIQNGNLTSIMYWLRFNHPQYGNKLEITGTINTAIELTPEQQADISRALALVNIIKTEEVKNGKRKSRN
ncbi:MAG: hypothetical protein WCG99_03620 [Candidatus Berkelbacteria bacterium]